MTARELLYTIFPWELAPGIPADELTAVDVARPQLTAAQPEDQR